MHRKYPAVRRTKRVQMAICICMCFVRVKKIKNKKKEQTREELHFFSRCRHIIKIVFMLNCRDQKNVLPLIRAIDLQLTPPHRTLLLLHNWPASLDAFKKNNLYSLELNCGTRKFTLMSHFYKQIKPTQNMFLQCCHRKRLIKHFCVQLFGFML